MQWKAVAGEISPTHAQLCTYIHTYIRAHVHIWTYIHFVYQRTGLKTVVYEVGDNSTTYKHKQSKTNNNIH